MENTDEDVYYAEIANLKEVLAAPSSDENDGLGELVIDTDVSDEETFDNSVNDNGERVISNPYLDLDEIVLDKSAPTPRMCRAIGSACYDVLFILEKQLLALLEKCRTKIKNLQDRIDSTKNPSERTLMTRGSWYCMFGIPYFKDRHYFPCPPNDDHFKKTANMELSIIDLPALRQWKEKDKSKLMAAVKAQEVANQIKEAESRKKSILKTLNCEDEPLKVEELETSLEDCNRTFIETKSLAELVGCSKLEYDWMKISVLNLEGLHSADECRAMWHNYLHPMIRKTKWTKDEDNKLKELVVKYEDQNWDAIAQELGTQRSAYQCMLQYQTRLNDSLRKSKWTEEEDDYLKEVVEGCRLGSYIPWSKVTYFMNGRSKSQVFNRWAYSLNPSIKKGRFTEEEDILVVAAVRRYGTDFSRVAQFLPGRTSVQVRDRYNSFLKRQSTGEPWTSDDDALLIALVREHGEGNWSKICQHFVNRNRTQVRHRYSTLQRWLKKVPGDPGNVLPAPSRRMNVESNREEKIWNRVQAIFGNMKTNTEMDEHNLMKLKENLHLCMKKRPGRKLGQKKVISTLSKQYYSFFRCVYTRFGGRKKLRYDEDVVQSSGQVVCNMLKYFQAHLNIPEDDSAIEGDTLLKEIDKFILRYLRDRKEHTNASETFEQDKTSTDLCNDILLVLADTVATKVPNDPSTPPEPTLAAIPAQVADISTMLPEPTSSNLLDTISRIPYLCPPNHTTLVGFRTILLSRRNIALNADNADKRSFVIDTDSDDSSVLNSGHITPEAAAALWKERLASLFVWPAIMSNTVPKVIDHLFQSDDPPVASTSCGGIDGSEIVATSSDNGDGGVTKLNTH